MAQPSDCLNCSPSTAEEKKDVGQVVVTVEPSSSRRGVKREASSDAVVTDEKPAMKKLKECYVSSDKVTTLVGSASLCTRMGSKVGGTMKSPIIRTPEEESAHRAEIAAVLESASQVASVINAKKEMKNNEPGENKPPRRFQRRNSFVIHRNKSGGLLSNLLTTPKFSAAGNSANNDFMRSPRSCGNFPGRIMLAKGRFSAASVESNSSMNASWPSQKET